MSDAAAAEALAQFSELQNEYNTTHQKLKQARARFASARARVCRPRVRACVRGVVGRGICLSSRRVGV